MALRQRLNSLRFGGRGLRIKRRSHQALTVNRNRNSASQKSLIATEVGPEVLTGSTRLKAGTSQKMVLNMLSTAVMVRLGHGYDNLMIDSQLTNQKLRHRVKRILMESSGKNLSAVEHALRQSGHNLRLALVMLKRGLTAKKAKRQLAAAKGDLRRALGE